MRMRASLTITGATTRIVREAHAKDVSVPASSLAQNLRRWTSQERAFNRPRLKKLYKTKDLWPALAVSGKAI
jgi:hypothetical protein